MQKMSFWNLVIEVTRKCNLTCDHCLRGRAQRKNITEEIIDRLLEQTKSITGITFTGGEPALNAGAIEYFTKRVKELEIPVSYFYLVTNGKRYSKKLVEALNELYDYCYNHDPYEAEDYCSLTVSRDQFHEDVSVGAYYEYSELDYFRDDKGSDIPENRVLNEGMAQEYGIGYDDVKPDKIQIDYWKDSIYVEDGTIYVNVEGDIVPGCDFSYKSQKKYKIGNVLEDTLENIICKACEEKDEEIAG